MKGLILLVPGTGLEPVRLLRSQDFKHYATLQKPTFQYKIIQKEDKIAHFYCTPIIIKNYIQRTSLES